MFVRPTLYATTGYTGKLLRTAGGHVNLSDVWRRLPVGAEIKFATGKSGAVGEDI
jgi:hypothetical protein